MVKQQPGLRGEGSCGIGNGQEEGGLVSMAGDGTCRLWGAAEGCPPLGKMRLASRTRSGSLRRVHQEMRVWRRFSRRGVGSGSGAVLCCAVLAVSARGTGIPNEL